MHQLKSIYFIVFALCLSLSSLSAFSQNKFQELKRFQTCWYKFVGKHFDKNVPYFSDIENGSLTGTQACMELLSLADLDQSYGNEGHTILIDENEKPLSEISASVLKNIHHMHASFLEGNSAQINDAFATEHTASMTTYFYEVGGGSYANYFTKHFFSKRNLGKPDYPFYKVFNDSETYKSVRYNRGGLSQKKIMTQTNSARSGVNIKVTECPGGCNYVISSLNLDESLFAKTSREDYAKLQGFIDVFGDKSAYSLSQKTFSSTDYRYGRAVDENGTPMIYETTLEVPVEDVQSFGTLIGIEKQKPIIPTNLHIRPIGLEQMTNATRLDGYHRTHLNPFLAHQPYPYQQNIYFNPGLGALTEFTQVNKAELTDQNGPNAPQDGADRVPRKWAEGFFKNVLCRELPVIRPADAIKYVDVNASYSEANYRHSSQCMSCHASMDNLGYLMRNVSYTSTNAAGATVVDGKYVTRELRVNYYFKAFLDSKITDPLLAQIHSKDPIARPYADTLFPLRLPDSDFRFRDMYGKYHEVPLRSSMSDQFASFRQLGDYLADLDDTYACFASKYLEQLTGIKLNLFDPGSDEAASAHLSQRDRELTKWIQLIAKDFKENQDAKKVVKEIVNSDVFLNPDDGKIPSQLSR